MAFKKKPRSAPKGAPEFMTTYGDMVSLTMVFFVMLFAMSNLDSSKYEAMMVSYAGREVLFQGNLGDSLGPASVGLLEALNSDTPSEIDGPITDEIKQEVIDAIKKGNELEKMASDFKTYAAKNDMPSGITTSIADGYFLINFEGSVLYDSGSAALKPEAMSIVDSISDWLLQYKGNNIRIEGHTDTVPMHTAMYPSNRHLSSARADTLVEYLVNVKGFAPEALSSAGMSEYFPVASNATAEGRAQNRRVEIKVYTDNVAADKDFFIPID